MGDHQNQSVEFTMDDTTGLFNAPIPEFQVAAILLFPVWSDVVQQIHDSIILAILIVRVIQMGIQ
jgi:hypothetical protein